MYVFNLTRIISHVYQIATTTNKKKKDDKKKKTTSLLPIKFSEEVSKHFIKQVVIPALGETLGQR